ncbi:cation diffusion facilitator family transporter [Paraburkholderia sp.]|uniref:cation diffusion facilitator family transporter n=1 Tax=Paraburkholderia sp. TaxID=1926495 RepID=UPI0039E2A53B
MFRGACASALVNAFLAVMQIALGLTARSDGLFADGIHTLGDLAGDAVVLLVLTMSAWHLKRPDARLSKRSGNGIEQAVASLFIAALLIFTAAEMLWQTVAQSSTLSASTALNVAALAVSGFVTLAKETLFRYLRAEGRRTGSALLLASAWHARVDAVSALVATVGLAGSLAGVPMLDAIAGTAIGLMILRMGYMSGRDAVRQLLAGRTGNDAVHAAHAARAPVTASRAVE